MFSKCCVGTPVHYPTEIRNQHNFFLYSWWANCFFEVDKMLKNDWDITIFVKHYKNDSKMGWMGTVVYSMIDVVILSLSRCKLSKTNILSFPFDSTSLNWSVSRNIVSFNKDLENRPIFLTIRPKDRTKMQKKYVYVFADL